MKNNHEDDYSLIYVAECGDEIELWELLPSIMLYCEQCNEFHKYLPVE
jgi:hypothetical protein